MTEKYHGSDPMSDVISDDYRMLQMMGRFGIALGFGNQTVEETCRQAGVHLPTFLTVVNYLKDPAHAHIGEMVRQIDLAQLIVYLKNSHSYFVDFRLPGIRRKLIEALDYSKPSQISMLILKFYDEYMAEVIHHMNYENEHIHPYVTKLLQGKIPSQDFSSLVKQHSGNHAGIEKSIEELKSIVLKYFPGQQNANLMGEVLMDIFMTEEDLQTHCRMEDTLFAESVMALEEELRLNHITPEEEEEQEGAVSDTLSERECDIIRQVAKGLSNKEIADALFISVNTVMTHRRNISRKLRIHSSAGLAVYAIANGLVNLDELQ